MTRDQPIAGESFDEGLLSIGALSSATGIPIDTIRTWERRYGFPVPERKPSGHRVYPLAIVPRLRRAAQAIARGHRAAEVLPASERALDALLDSVSLRGSSDRERSPLSIPSPDVDGDNLLGMVRRFDADALQRKFQSEWVRLGPIEFLERLAAPFLSRLGTAWAEGALEVRHEHFGSGVLGDFLRAVRAPLDERAAGPVVALATLPDELHGLGLQMAAVVFAVAGWRSLVLGVDTPVPQIVALAREARLHAVGLGCVQERPAKVAAALRALRRDLPQRVALLVGGHGASAPPRLRGVETMSDLQALDHWIRRRTP
jgi:MerR family transcriptional regulator, light-induced transcriptional regulator